VVRQRGALGKAGGARRVLDVDRIVEGQFRLAGREFLVGGTERREEQPRPGVGADVDHSGQSGALRQDLVDHRPVVGRLERLGRDEHADAGLLHHVLQLVRAVGGVDVHQDRADARGGVLHEHPLRDVRRPDADPLPLRDAERQQAPGEAVDLGVEPVVRPALAARDVDERLPVPDAGRGAAQVGPDRLAEQRLGRGSVGVRQQTHVVLQCGMRCRR
jgi:hypothetical protein